MPPILPIRFSEGSNMKNKAAQVGFGLIEVLVTLLIVSIGLLVIAKFQSSVTNESRFNKTRSEATALCEDALTPYRQPLTLSEFNALGNITNATFTGTTEIITLNVTAVNTAASTKELTATCTWGDATPEQTVRLSTEVSSNSLTLAALSAGAGDSGVDGLSPSLNAGASDEIADRISLVDANGQRIGVTTVSVGSTGSDGVAPEDGGFKIGNQVYVVDPSGNTATAAFLCIDNIPVSEGSIGTVGYTSPNSTQPIDFETFKARRLKDSAGNITAEIELFEPRLLNFGGGNKEYCIPRVRYNGGVIVAIRGTITSGVLDNQGNLIQFNLFTFDISESGTYCVLDQTDPNASSVPYSCYVGGNCSNGPTGNDDNDFFQCPSSLPNVINVDGPGGWRGRIGVLGLAELGYSTCYFEEIETNTDGTRDTARNYYSRFSVSSALPSPLPEGFFDGETYLRSFDKNQGLNQPQACHDFLIIDAANSPQYSQFRSACQAAEAAVEGIRPASKNIQRDILVNGVVSGGVISPQTSELLANLYNPTVDQFWCDIKTYTLRVQPTGVYVGIPSVKVVDSSNNEYPCTYSLDGNNTLTHYTCEFSPGQQASEISVSGIQGSTFSAAAPCDTELSLNENGSITGADGAQITSCDISFSAPSPLGDYTQFSVSGLITADSGLDTANGVNRLAVSLSELGSELFGCVINQTVSTAENSYTCDFYAAPTGTAPFDVETGAGFSLDVEVSPIDLTGGSSITGPTIPLTVIPPPTPYAVSGTLSISAGISAVPVISSSGNLAICEFTGSDVPSGPDEWADTNTPYTCTVDSGESTTITFAISPECTEGGASKAHLVSANGNTPTKGLSTYDASADATVNVTISLGSNNSCRR